MRQLKTSVPWKLLLIIDGVDECNREDDQANLIRTFAKLLKKPGPTSDCIALQSCGTSHQNGFQCARYQEKFTSIHPGLCLPAQQRRSSFPTKQLSRDSRNASNELPARARLAVAYTYEGHSAKIIGQFIYGAVVVKFISHPRMHPATQLEIIRGLRPSGANAPFAELDAIYSHIFSQVRDLQMVINILAYMIIGENEYVPYSTVFGI